MIGFMVELILCWVLIVKLFFNCILLGMWWLLICVWICLEVILIMVEVICILLFGNVMYWLLLIIL